tara:strand:+ start:115 stop:441 length:327 start_codon:yes stop_codon:yes gene_type:complete
MNSLKQYANHLPTHLLLLLAAVSTHRNQAKNYQRSIGYSAPSYCEGEYIPSSLKQEASALVSKASDLLNETYLLCNLPARNVRPSPTLDGINAELATQQKYLKRLTNK